MILTKATDKEVKAETISRIKTLIDKYNLNPNVLKYFRKGQVYYSYLTAMGMMGSIDTISYNEDYETDTNITLHQCSLLFTPGLLGTSTDVLRRISDLCFWKLTVE